MGDVDTPGPLRARREADDRESALDLLVEESRATRREMRSGFAEIQKRLATGDTSIALIQERQSNQGTSIASLTGRVDEIDKQSRALACEDCEGRIDRLESWRNERAAVEADADKRRTWQPPWWLLLVATALAGVVTAFGAKLIGAGP